jgi:hypothetical protein
LENARNLTGIKEALFSMLNFRGGGVRGIRTNLPKYYAIGLENICDIKNRETKLIKL